MTTTYSPADRVARAVDAAILTATIDREAPKDERVRFNREHLDKVALLYKAHATRDEAYRTVQDRISAALDASLVKYGTDPGDAWIDTPEWHDAMAAAWLRSRLDALTDSTYAQAADGSLELRARRALGDYYL